MVLPCDNLNLRSECSQREPRGRQASGRLPEHVEHHLSEFLVKEISLHLSIEMIKRNLHQRHDYNIVDVFNAIDVTHDGFLNYRNI
jgi:hypothetical protein